MSKIFTFFRQSRLWGILQEDLALHTCQYDNFGARLLCFSDINFSYDELKQKWGPIAGMDENSIGEWSKAMCRPMELVGCRFYSIRTSTLGKSISCVWWHERNNPLTEFRAIAISQSFDRIGTCIALIKSHFLRHFFINLSFERSGSCRKWVIINAWRVSHKS